MRIGSRKCGVLVGSLVLACAAEPPVVPSQPAVAVATPEPGPVAAATPGPSAGPAAAATPGPAAAATPGPIAGPVAAATAGPAAAATPEPAPQFDAATATRVRAKIVAIPNRKQWVPCGVLHSVGALEVEVQGVGEPAPRMILFVSCPADLRRGPALVVGATLEFKLYARKQPWPGVRPLPDLPRRYVAGIADQAAGGTL